MTDAALIHTDLEGLARWQWPDLPAQFSLGLPGADSLPLEPVRFLPGRRLVCFSPARPGSVFKLYLGRRGQRDYQHESDMLIRLAEAGLPVPTRLEGAVGDGGAWLELERLEGAQPLGDRLHEPEWLPRYADLLLLLYQKGWQQTDPHLDNFLVSDGNLWLIDAGAIEAVSSAAAERTENAGLVLAQFSALQTVQEVELRSLLASRLEVPESRLELATQSARQWRIRRYLGKSRRESTAVEAFAEESLQGLVARDLPQADRDQLLAAIRLGKGEQALKSGNSATVYTAGEFVVKRYNCRSTLDRIKRKLGRDRALKAWSMGRALRHFGLPTPEPVLYARGRQGVLYLVTRYQPGVELKQMAEHGQAGDRHWQACRDLLSRMHAFGFWHGDAKARNFILQDGQAWLIDLDACGWSDKPGKVRRLARRDMARFNRNEGVRG